MVRALVVQQGLQLKLFFLKLDFDVVDLSTQRADLGLGVDDGAFVLQADQFFLRFTTGGFGLDQTFLCVDHSVGSFAQRQVVDTLFCVADQHAAEFSGDFGVGCGDLHFHDAFGRVIADLNALFINLIGLFVRRILFQALDRVDGRIGKVAAETKIGI